MSVPTVSIGMPVRNEEGHVGAALECLLAQDYADFEIVVSDNASNDATHAICADYAARDSRVQVVRQPVNLGATGNFEAVRKLARGRYFMWASGHDEWSGNALSACVQVMESDSDVVVATPTCIWLDVSGNQAPVRSSHVDSRGLGAIARMQMVFWGSMNPVLGMIRRAALETTRGMLDIVGGDLVLLTELSLLGPFAHCPDARFYRRLTRPPETHTERMSRYSSKEVALGGRLARWLPLASLPIEMVRAVLRAPISVVDRSILLAVLAPSLPARYVVGRKQVR